MSQTKVAQHLGQTQTFISKCELGERRLDFVEVGKYCDGIGLPYEEFTAKYVVALQSLPPRKRKQSRARQKP